MRPAHAVPMLLALALETRAAPSRAAEPVAPPMAIEWRWRRVQPWEYATTAVTLGVGFYLRFVAPPRDANWTGGILFDEALRNRVAVSGLANRSMVSTFTDVMFFGAMGYRFVDSILVPGLGWRNWDVALQMTMIDLESFGLVAITLW